MNCLLAFDKFKGALPAAEAVRIAEAAMKDALPSAVVEQAPLTDGGEGFATILATALGGELYQVEVPGPRFKPVTGNFALVEASVIPAAALERLQLSGSAGSGKIAFVEMASASGYESLSEDERDPWQTSTIGTGELMKAAVAAGAKAIVLGIGGSATNDCGAGALEALGVLYYDRELQSVSNITPATFKLVNTLGSTSHLLDTFPPVRIGCDVTNPLLGETGATRVFGPQKGLQAEDFDRLERQMDKMGRRILGLFGKSPETWEKHLSEPGSGAAGGIGFALRHALPDSRFVEGFPLVAELLGLAEKSKAADLVITGEGRLDESSLGGKGPVGLLQMLERNKRVLFLTGSAEMKTIDQLQNEFPNLKVIPISDPDWPLEEALRRTPESLRTKLLEALKDD
ncbi:MAG: glycerate kinase [Puniceicoccaceae bacterium]